MDVFVHPLFVGDFQGRARVVRGRGVAAGLRFGRSCVAPVWYGGGGALSRLAVVLDASRPCGTGAWGIHLRLAFRSVGRASVVRGRGATSDFRAVLAKVASVWGRGV